MICKCLTQFPVKLVQKKVLLSCSAGLYFCDDHWDNIFSLMKLLSYVRTTECKFPLLPGFCYSPCKSLVLSVCSVTSAMTDMHRNRLALASNCQEPENLRTSCVSKSNCFGWPSTTVRDGQTHNYNYDIFICTCSSIAMAWCACSQTILGSTCTYSTAMCDQDGATYVTVRKN